jgi:hypothetical protein
MKPRTYYILMAGLLLFMVFLVLLDPVSVCVMISRLWRP